MEDRNRSRMDVEFYLLNRDYNELSLDELAVVSEYVESEQQFNEMKAVVMGVGNFFKEDGELAPNPAIKAALLKEFDKHQPARAYWLNGILVSLFPKEKKFLQKPGMQLIGLAASVLLIVTITFNGNADVNNSKLSQYEDFKAEEQVFEEVGELERGEVNEEKILVENLEITVHETAEMHTTSDADYFSNENNLNTSEESLKNGISKNREIAVSEDKLVISEITPVTAEVIEEVSSDDEGGYFADVVSAAGASVPVNNSMDLPLNSRTLAQDADLIGILYTAM